MAADLVALILIDNLEHVLPSTPVVVELLKACPGLKILATSRERLRLSGEHDVPVLPLACPDPEQLPSPAQVRAAPAVRLFVERAQAVNPGFQLTAANSTTVAAICHRLDGLPLALELAAARSAHMSPALLLARLAHRLPLLSGGPRDVPDRLRTMHDAISWSYALLNPAEQSLFRRLSVFAGGFTLEAAEAVGWTTGDRPAEEHGRNPPAARSPYFVLDAVASLIDKSLIRWADTAGENHSDGEVILAPRLVMLETIREFGLEQLSASVDEDETRHAHVQFCLDLAERAWSLAGDERHQLSILESERANLRAALAWAIDQAPVPALRLATRLKDFWLEGFHHVEGRDWMERALGGVPAADAGLRSEALSTLGELRRHLGDNAAAKAAFEEAQVLAQAEGQHRVELAAMSGLAALAVDAAVPGAAALSETMAMISRDIGDRRSLAESLHNLAWTEAGRGRVAEALALFGEARLLARSAGDYRGLAHILNSTGNLHAEQGELDAAQALLQESLDLARAVDDQREVSETLVDLGWLALEMGNTVTARARFAEVLPLAHPIARLRDAIFALEGCAVIAMGEGRHSVALHLIDATIALRSGTDMPMADDPRIAMYGPATVRETLRVLAGATERYEGKTWSLNEALIEATTIVQLPVVPPDPLGALSARERDVFRLLAEGRTDRQIADDLFITRRTASKHVSAILAKLGAANRTEAIAASNLQHTDC